MPASKKPTTVSYKHSSVRVALHRVQATSRTHLVSDHRDQLSRFVGCGRSSSGHFREGAVLDATKEELICDVAVLLDSHPRRVRCIPTAQSTNLIDEVVARLESQQQTSTGQDDDGAGWKVGLDDAKSRDWRER